MRGNGCLLYWNDKLNANSPAGYNRQTAHLYSSLGLEISRNFGGAWLLGARAEFDLFWAGLNHNTDLPLAEDETVDLRQRSGYGAQLAVFLRHPVTRALGLEVEPFFQYWNIGESEQASLLTPDGIYTLCEPANATAMFGLRGVCAGNLENEQPSRRVALIGRNGFPPGQPRADKPDRRHDNRQHDQDINLVGIFLNQSPVFPQLHAAQQEQ